MGRAEKAPTRGCSKGQSVLLAQWQPAVRCLLGPNGRCKRNEGKTANRHCGLTQACMMHAVVHLALWGVMTVTDSLGWLSWMGDCPNTATAYRSAAIANNAIVSTSMQAAGSLFC